MRIAIALSAAALLAATATAGSADARGCVRGAVVGGVAGHFAGHHPIAGAALGCIVMHHHYKVQDRRERRWDRGHR